MCPVTLTHKRRKTKDKAEDTARRKWKESEGTAVTMNAATVNPQQDSLGTFRFRLQIDSKPLGGKHKWGTGG